MSKPGDGAGGPGLGGDNLDVFQFVVNFLQSEGLHDTTQRLLAEVDRLSDLGGTAEALKAFAAASSNSTVTVPDLQHAIAPASPLAGQFEQHGLPAAGGDLVNPPSALAQLLTSASLRSSGRKKGRSFSKQTAPWPEDLDEYDGQEDAGYVRQDVEQHQFEANEIDLQDQTEQHFFTHRSLPPRALSEEEDEGDGEESSEGGEEEESSSVDLAPHSQSNSQLLPSAGLGNLFGSNSSSMLPPGRSASGAPPPPVADETWDLGPMDIKFAEPVTTPTKPASDRAGADEPKPVLSRVESLSSSFKDFDIEREEDGTCVAGGRPSTSGAGASAGNDSSGEVDLAAAANLAASVQRRMSGSANDEPMPEVIDFQPLAAVTAADLAAFSLHPTVNTSSKSASNTALATGGTSPVSSHAPETPFSPSTSQLMTDNSKGGEHGGGFTFFPISSPKVEAAATDSRIFKSWPSVRSSCTSEVIGPSDDDHTAADYADDEYSRSMSKPASRSPSRNLSDSGLASYKPLAGEDADGVTSGPSTWSFTRTGSQQATSASGAEARHSSSQQKGAPRREPSLDLVAGLVSSASGAGGVAGTAHPVLGSGTSSISEPGRDEAGQRSPTAGQSGNTSGNSTAPVSSSPPDVARGDTQQAGQAAGGKGSTPAPPATPGSATKQGQQGPPAAEGGVDISKQGQSSPSSKQNDASSSDQTPASPQQGKSEQPKQAAVATTPAASSSSSQQAGDGSGKVDSPAAGSSSTFILLPSTSASAPISAVADELVAHMISVDSVPTSPAGSPPQPQPIITEVFSSIRHDSTADTIQSEAEHVAGAEGEAEDSFHEACSISPSQGENSDADDEEGDETQGLGSRQGSEAGQAATSGGVNWEPIQLEPVGNATRSTGGSGSAPPGGGPFSPDGSSTTSALPDTPVMPRYTVDETGAVTYEYDEEYIGAKYEVFNLRVYHRRHRTGFEETKDFPIRLNDLIAGRYQVMDFLGSAAFSRAVQALDTKTGMLVCLKIIKNNKDYFDQSLDEIKLLKYVNAHDPTDAAGIVRLYDFFYYKEHLFLVCELLRANLYEFQKYNRESGDPPYFTNARIQRIARQVLSALAFLHSLGLIHSDLKPENILIKSYSRCEVKVIDLGSSCFITDQLSSYVQSRSYRAPEVILGLPYDQKVDVWSLGCILAELSSGFVLFQNDSLATLLARLEGILGPMPDWMVRKGRYSSRFYTRGHNLYERNTTTERYELLVPKKTSLRHRAPDADEGLLSFIAYLLHIDPHKRPTAAEALQHPWLQHQYPSLDA